MPPSFAGAGTLDGSAHSQQIRDKSRPHPRRFPLGVTTSMSTTAVPLDDLAQHIARQKAELERLHQEYETRTSQLASLESRKAELESQLRQVDADIQAVA